MVSLIRYLVPSGKEDGTARELREDDEDDDPVHVFGQVVDAVIRNGRVEARVMPGINSSPLDRWRQMKSSRQMQRVADEAAQTRAQTAAQTAALAEAVKGLSLAAAHDDGADLSTVVVEGAGLGVCNGIYHPAPNDHQANGKPFFRNQHGTTIGWQDSDWTRRHGYRAGIGCWGIGYAGHHRYMARGDSPFPPESAFHPHHIEHGYEGNFFGLSCDDASKVVTPEGVGPCIVKFDEGKFAKVESVTHEMEHDGSKTGQKYVYISYDQSGANQRMPVARFAPHEVLLQPTGGGVYPSHPPSQLPSIERVLNPPEEARQYSSVWDGDARGQGHARSMLDSQQAWSAGQSRVGEWMVIDAGNVVRLIGIVVMTRGHSCTDQLVQMLRVEVSDNGVAWREQAMAQQAMAQQAMAQHGVAGGSPVGHQPRGGKDLIMRMNATPHSSDKIKLIEEFFTGSWHLDDREFVAVFKALTHDSDMRRAAEIMSRNMRHNHCAALAGAMEASPHSSTKMGMIECMCPHITDFRNIHLVFKGLTFSSDIVSAAELFGRHCQGNLPAEALVEVLNCTPHSSDKMRIIEAMRYKVVGNKQCVIDHLTFSSDKDKARQLLF
ncbi:hypothetical protein Ctob_015722 [Chrysochromulina tobinii]|uniref:F5/8 type C domain-containing protein n=1 Tax=Chrysochromulina tobinii TaxID=1460289 RepID=A0A0M0LPP0_9EUKA|nr:hypothetical protein Ctob_015722 [Chrysochromulina tobinii]|eukprot:KOO52956.1 hypothetical protein Ctob_015722 [Chrysochromulina sp. CCMP291]